MHRRHQTTDTLFCVVDSGIQPRVASVASSERDQEFAGDFVDVYALFTT
jgi:hypothetical protein